MGQVKTGTVHLKPNSDFLSPPLSESLILYKLLMCVEYMSPKTSSVYLYLFWEFALLTRIRKIKGSMHIQQDS